MKIELWKLLVLIFLLQIIAGTLCTIYNNLIFRNPTYFEFFFDFQKTVHLTGILPTIMLILFLETSYYKSISQSQKVDSLSSEKESTFPRIQITGEKDTQSVTLPLYEIICISSLDNYLKIETHKNNEIQKPRVIRGTLKYIEENYADIELLYKCHRSHIVNLIWVKEIYGNSLNKKLKSKIGNITIPISRTKTNEIIKKLKSLE